MSNDTFMNMTIAKDVRNYLKNKPYVLEAIESGFVNFSELSRQIQKELQINNTTAIKAALLRFSSEIKRKKHRREERVLKLLQESTITVQDGKAVVISKSQIPTKEQTKVHLNGNFVYLLNKGDVGNLEGKIKAHENCVMLTIHSPEHLETTPGVVAFLTSLLAEQGINIVEFISCWTDTIIVVEKRDSVKTYEILSSLLSR